ncbi:hypothetical protein OH492_23690 [Vibrio chagasii]|nr:hypothetical protein [Vibrio chagasii]
MILFRLKALNLTLKCELSVAVITPPMYLSGIHQRIAGPKQYCRHLVDSGAVLARYATNGSTTTTELCCG